MMTLPANIIEIVARAGGGGSGGGGGGDGAPIFILIGYAIGYTVTKFVKRFVPSKLSLKVSIVATSLLTLVGLIMTIWAMVVYDAGSAFVVILIMGMVIAGLWIGWHSAYYQWWEKSAEMMKRAVAAMHYAAQKDPKWNPEQLEAYTRDVFFQFQNDWSNFDVESMRHYLIPKYHEHMTLVMQSLYEMGRQNIVMDPQILRIKPAHVLDHADDEQDIYEMAIEAKAHDVLVDMETGRELFRDERTFTEVWKFEGEGDWWMLTGIHQTTADEGMREREIMRLAEENGMFYSLDWGWLLLPERGQLFSQGAFGVSDINNHVIGLFDGLLTQIYTYVPVPARKYATSKRYLIGQINLPRSYGNILILSRKADDWNMLEKVMHYDYQEYSMEWTDFNQRYQVLATDPDRLAAFELVNPGFMAYLYDLDTSLSIEVVDSIVYFYTQGLTTAVTYRRFLGLLTRAHKELRM